MLSATQPRRRELLTPGVVRHLPRCRLFPLIAPAARFGRGPRFDRFDTKPIRFVRSVPARVADRPARLAAPAHMRGAVLIRFRVVVASRVGRYRAAARRIALVAFGPGRRGSRASNSGSVLAGPGSSRCRRRLRAGPSWGGVRARVSVPRALVPRPASCSGLVRRSVPRPGGSSRRRTAEPAESRPADVRPWRRRDSDSSTDSYQHCASDAPSRHSG